MVSYTRYILFYKLFLIFYEKSEDDLILQYSHKKFDRHELSNLKRKIFEEEITNDLVIKKVSIFPQNDSTIAHSYQKTNKR